MLKEMEMFEKGWFVIEVCSRMSKGVKSALASMVVRSGLEDEIFNVAISPMKEYGNYVFVNMVTSPRAISAILRLRNVKKFLGSNHNPMSLTKAEIDCMF